MKKYASTTCPILTEYDEVIANSSILCPLMILSSVSSGRLAIFSAVMLPRARFVLMNSFMIISLPTGLFFIVGKPSCLRNEKAVLIDSPYIPAAMGSTP